MLNSLEPGKRLTRAGPPLTLEAFSGFGALLGTDAPIHNDPAYAAKTPFGNVIAQGPLLLALFKSWFCEMFGEQAWSSGGRMDAKFLHPAAIGDVVTLEIIIGTVTDSRTAFELRVVCNERLLVSGNATLDLND